MKTVEISASRRYPVYIDSGLLSDLGAHVRRVARGNSAAIVSDTNVWPLYGEKAEDSLKSAGFHVVSYVFEAGESGKSGNNYLSLMNFLAENKLTRTDCLLALGGGVAGDLTGFAAATYLRGIDYIQVPTTVMAAVDSSVGGKTAINLPAGKNLAGVFYQPRLVLCDTDTLSTLPVDVFRDGCAEIIKYAVLYDPALFRYLETAGPDFDRERVIARCVELKQDVVAADEFDTGARMKLNLGHTFGHGIESCSGYTVSHGKAVSIGTSIISRAFGCPDAQAIVNCLSRFGLPTDTDYPPEDICAYALSDKKRSGGTVSLIVPRRIGCCDIVNTPTEQLISILQAGL